MLHLSHTPFRIPYIIEHRSRTATIALSLLVCCALAGLAQHSKNETQVDTVFTAKLPNVLGQSITLQKVSYRPGGKSPAHSHSGSVLAYVLSGSIRSENSATGPARIYKTGESFFEPPRSHHLISENASLKEPASLLAIFIADDGADLTTPLSR